MRFPRSSHGRGKGGSNLAADDDDDEVGGGIVIFSTVTGVFQLNDSSSPSSR